MRNLCIFYWHFLRLTFLILDFEKFLRAQFFWLGIILNVQIDFDLLYFISISSFLDLLNDC